MQKIQTFLWFDSQTEDAARFYTSIFKNSKILNRMPSPGGKPMGVTLELDRRQFIAFNGGPERLVLTRGRPGGLSPFRPSGPGRRTIRTGIDLFVTVH